MAGLSIKRRRKAWLKGVAFGAAGLGRCRFVLPKLQDIFNRGAQHGRANTDAPYVKAVVDQMKRRFPERKSTRVSPRRSSSARYEPRPRPWGPRR